MLILPAYCSGRLETKADEKRVVDECCRLSRLLGGKGRHADSSYNTLPKIVRGFATGKIRAHLEAQAARIQVLAHLACAGGELWLSGCCDGSS